ncbi:MAG: DNA-processing protein DprA [Candidatus Humimicrobiaceae bacterium]
MPDEETSLKILDLLVEMKIRPLDFINIFKIKKDVDLTIEYFRSKDKNHLSLFKESENKSGSSERISSFVKCLMKNNSFMLDITQQQYPELLKEIYFPPPLLFCKGEKILKENSLKIAIVGKRDCSEYGKEAAAYLSRELSKTGFMIVSGMALGIDKTAHVEALKEKGGSIGVLGTGIDISYPYENKKLYSEILENGGIITEFLPQTPPLKCNFPARNRIISGVSVGVIVIEADERSGAVVTAKSAIRENREVFAVPGSIFSDRSKGCHMLIKSGAKLAESIDDILEELTNYIKNPVYRDSVILKPATNRDNMTKGLSSESNHNKSANNDRIRRERISPQNFPDNDYLKIYQCLGFRVKSLEEITQESCLNINKVLQVLSYFQLNNIIKENSFNNFIKVFH